MHVMWHKDPCLMANQGKRLGEWLEKHGLSQGEFAAKIGSTQSHVSKLISGERDAGRDLAFAIEHETGGAIPANGWGAAPRPRRLRPASA